MIIMRWNERIGAELIAKYPEEIQISDKTLVQIYSTHEYSGEAGMVSLSIGPLNIASYTTGAEKGLYVVLLLNVDEDPDLYEDGLADVARVVLANFENKEFMKLLPSMFQRLSTFPTLKPEQKLAMLYLDEVKRMVLQRLEEEGAIYKSELAIWLKDVYHAGFVDIESISAALIKEGFAKGASLKGIPSEILFLVGDILIVRHPPVFLFNECTQRGLPASLREQYQTEIKSFFAAYTASDADNLALLDVLVDPATYESLSLMRGAIVTRDDLEKLKKKGVENVDAVLKVLWDKKMLVVLRDEKGNEYYGLLSDVLVQRIFPDFMVNNVRKNYKEKSKADPVLVEHLNILEEQYNSNNAKVSRAPEEITTPAKKKQR